MIRKLFLVALWFPLTLVLLIVNLTMLAAMSRWDAPAIPLSAVSPGESSFAAAGTSEVLSATVIAGDARAILLSSFLRSHGSPMTPYADLIVREADTYHFDFRLLPAIAMCESNLGKRVPLKAGFNPFGIAVYTGADNGKSFDSWEDAIEWVSKYLYDKYYSQGITNLSDIGQIWAPPSVENGDSWANCVEYFRDSIL